MPYCLLYSEDVLYLIGTELQQNVQPDIHSSRKYDQRSLGDGGNNKTESILVTDLTKNGFVTKL